MGRENRNLPRRWLVIDVPFLCHRCFHAIPALRHKEVNTQVIYGVFKDLVGLMERFDTSDVVLCFDYGYGIRKKMFPGYKAKRNARKDEEDDEEKKRVREHFRKQMDALRDRYLAEIGFANIQFQKGYESDDLIATCCAAIPEDDSAIIVSADADLLQLIRHNISFYSPATQKMTTLQSFAKTYGFPPSKWWKVKAIGGCRTDEVPGMAPGIAEGRAITYVAGKMKDGAIKTAIRSEKYAANFLRNKELVRLPLAGAKTFPLKPGCRLSEEGWHRVCDELGFRSMLRSRKNNPFFRLCD